jgi:NtrC-family two-component system response regulator AlgB
VVEQCLARRAAQHRLAELEEKVAEAVPEADLETDSPGMRAALDVIAKAAGSDAPILFRGESGTGKGVLARALHAQSGRSQRPFVTVNCPTLSEDLLASELFGHVTGAFTGAVRDQAGRVEAAEGGTLFLDEVGEISTALQAKLLRFLQERQFERVGENRTRRADVRIVAATNRRLEEDIAAGRFREDLLFRLNVIEVSVPPLRQRPEDIPRMARAVLAFFARAAGCPVPELSPEAEAALVAYPWPGNVRELEHWIESEIHFAAPTDSCLRRLNRQPTAAARQPRAPRSLREVERELFATAMVDAAGDISRAARDLGISRGKLYRKLRIYGLLPK